MPGCASQACFSSLLVRAAAARAVPATAALTFDDREVARAEQREVLSDRRGHRPMNLDAHPVQSRKGAGAYPSDDDGVDPLILERLHRVAGAVRVMLIPVRNRLYGVALRVDDHEDRGGAEMVEHDTVDSDVILDGKSNSHANRLRFQRGDLHDRQVEMPNRVYGGQTPRMPVASGMIPR